MERINGHQNILGRMWRKAMTRTLSDGSQFRNCGRCPVQMNTMYIQARNGDGELMYDENGRPLTQERVITLAMDGEA